jgi:hypothetical protein
MKDAMDTGQEGTISGIGNSAGISQGAAAVARRTPAS